MKEDVETRTFVDKNALRDGTDHGINDSSLISKWVPRANFVAGGLTIAKKLDGTQLSAWRVGQHQTKMGQKTAPNKRVGKFDLAREARSS
jgi:hypothetical protein